MRFWEQVRLLQSQGTVVAKTYWGAPYVPLLVVRKLALGFGVGPGTPDWGRQLSDGRDLIGQNWGAVLVPGLLIIITAAAINLLGDWLQEVLDQCGNVFAAIAQRGPYIFRNCAP